MVVAALAVLLVAGCGSSASPTPKSLSHADDKALFYADTYIAFYLSDDLHDRAISQKETDDYVGGLDTVVRLFRKYPKARSYELDKTMRQVVADEASQIENVGGLQDDVDMLDRVLRAG